jgi:DeoR family glycerol-3-phosphate regulon repressor/DeoR family fructose operon transcriptional repressor
VAKHLEAKTPHVITNSLPVANLFSGSARMEVVVTGGLIYPKLGVLVGPLAIAAFTQVHADFAIMSCGGVTANGVTNSHGLLIEIQRAMMDSAQRVILCADHTKFGRQSMCHLCELESIDVLITDTEPPEEMQTALAAADVQLIVATGEGAKAILPKERATLPASVTAAEEAGTSTGVEEKDAFID